MVAAQRARVRTPACAFAERAPAAQPTRARDARRSAGARSCSPTATRCAPRPRSSPAASSSAAIRSRPRPRSCSSSAARSGSTAARCCRPRTRSPGIGAAVGASFAGKKAMTATSGPGMSLKTEMLGLATIAELPLVCVNVQRGGPSTGHADQERAVRPVPGRVLRPRRRRCGPVLAPTSVADTFGVTVEAFNIAEALPDAGDRALRPGDRAAQGDLDPIDTSRVRDRGAAPARRRRSSTTTRASGSRSPASARSASPGWPAGNYLASGIEHNERGAPTASGAVHARMNEKRFRKLRRRCKRRRDLFERRRRPATAPLGARRLGQRAPACAARRSSARGGEGLRREAARARASSTRWPRRSTGTSSRSVRARPGGRAVAPGPALPPPAHVRGRARGRARRSPAAAPTRFVPTEIVDRLREPLALQASGADVASHRRER